MISSFDKSLNKKLTIADYIERKRQIENTTFIIKAGTGVGVYLVEGVEVPVKEFEQAHKMFIMNFNAYNTKGPSNGTRRDWLTTD